MIYLFNFNDFYFIIKKTIQESSLRSLTRIFKKFLLMQHNLKFGYTLDFIINIF